MPGVDRGSYWKLRGRLCADVGSVCRSPWKRLFEVVFLVLITAALWFSVAYSSPCKPLPLQVSAPEHTPTIVSCLSAVISCSHRNDHGGDILFILLQVDLVCSADVKAADCAGGLELV